MSAPQTNAERIISEVIESHSVDRYAFFSRANEHYLVAARIEAATRLRRELELTSNIIARMLKRNGSTVRYYLNPKLRARKRAPQATWANSILLKILANDVRALVVEVAQAEHTTPEIIIAERMREWAQEAARERAAA